MDRPFVLLGERKLFSFWVGTFDEDWTDVEIEQLFIDFQTFLDSLSSVLSYIITNDGEGDIEITLKKQWNNVYEFIDTIHKLVNFTRPNSIHISYDEVFFFKFKDYNEKGLISMSEEGDLIQFVYQEEGKVGVTEKDFSLIGRKKRMS